MQLALAGGGALREDVHQKIRLKVVDEQPQQTGTPASDEPQVSVLLRADYARAAVAFTVVSGTASLVAMYAMAATAPWIYEEQSMLPQAAVVAIVYATMLCMFGFFAIKHSLKTEGASESYDVAIGEAGAFELCIENIPARSIRKIDEANRVIEFASGIKQQTTLRICEVSENASRIEVNRTIQPEWCVLFWKADCQRLMDAIRLHDKIGYEPIIRKIQERAKEMDGIVFGASGPEPLYVEKSAPRPTTAKIAVGVGCYLAFCWSFFTFTHLNSVIKYTGKRNPSLAIAMCDLRLRICPADHTVWNKRGDLHLQLSDYKAAESDFRKAESKGLNGLGASLILQGRLDEAAKVVDQDETSIAERGLTPKAMATELANIEAQRSWIATLSEKPELGVQHANEAIRLNSRLGFAFNARGYAFHQMKNDEHAIADYDTAIGINPNNPIGLALRSVIEKNQGDLESATRDRMSAFAAGFNREYLVVPPQLDEFGEPLDATTPIPGRSVSAS